MRAYEVSKPYMRLLSMNDFYNANLNVAFYEVIGSNRTRYIALQDPMGRPLTNITELVISDKKKVPVYKQAMAMQMGQIPKTIVSSQRIIRVRQIKPIPVTYDFYIARI